MYIKYLYDMAANAVDEVLSKYSLEGVEKFDANQIGTVTYKNLTKHDGGFTSTTSDPQILYKFKTKLPRGWYLFRFKIQTDIALSPEVFFPVKNKYSEENKFSLIRKRSYDLDKDVKDIDGHGTEIAEASGQHIYQALVYFPHAISKLRFDPHDEIGDLNELALEITRPRISKIEQAVSDINIHTARRVRRKIECLGGGRLKIKNNEFLYFNDAVQAAIGRANPYKEWIKLFDYHSKQKKRYKTKLASMEQRPLISILMPVYNCPETYLNEAIGSVVAQLYPNWELCIVDDCSTAPEVKPVLETWQLRDPRIKVRFSKSNGHISRATNQAFEMSSGEFIAMMDHDDVLREHALAEVALCINKNPEAELIYSDEDKITEKGKRYAPYFKSEWSPDLFLSQNYLNHLSVFKRDAIRLAGGWREGFEGSQDYDLILRVIEKIDQKNIHHIPKILYHWRAIEGSTAKSGSEKSYAYVTGKAALEDHLKRSKINAHVEEVRPFYKVKYAMPAPEPLVSLIIPTRNMKKLLSNCVSSILNKTIYSKYEFLFINNQSDEKSTLRYLENIAQLSKMRVIEYDKPFNYSAINNQAVREARGEIVGLINNDIEVISPEWLSLMVSHAVRPEIGCVGAKLFYRNDRIQHAGVVLGLGGVAGHGHHDFSKSSAGYFGRLKVTQNYSAVTAACLLVRAALYKEVGGFNEANLKVAFNDVDFCLKVREKGYLSLWEPDAHLYHLERVSRGFDDTLEKKKRFENEVRYMKQRWGDLLQNDPYYSPNLSLKRNDFSIKID